MIAIEQANRIAACLAFRHIDEVKDHEREAVLVALVHALPEREAKLAQDTLFAFRESRRLQMVLTEVIKPNLAA